MAKTQGVQMGYMKDNKEHTILSQHQSSHSSGNPLIHARGIVQRVIIGPSDHHGAYHQHFTMTIDQVTDAGGSNIAQGQTVFVAVWVGDNKGHYLAEVRDLTGHEPIHVKGEYYIDATLDAIEDNANPVLPVIVAESVFYHGQHYGREGMDKT